jgi:hypothetical protein
MCSRSEDRVLLIFSARVDPPHDVPHERHGSTELINRIPSQCAIAVARWGSGLVTTSTLLKMPAQVFLGPMGCAVR